MNKRMIKTLYKRHRVLSEPSHIPNTFEDYQEMRDIGIALAEYAAETGEDYNHFITHTLITGAESNVMNSDSLTTHVMQTVIRESGLKAAAKLFLALEDIEQICPKQHERPGMRHV